MSPSITFAFPNIVLPDDTVLKEIKIKNKLNINLNPNKDDVISKGQGAIILK